MENLNDQVSVVRELKSFTEELRDSYKKTQSSLITKIAVVVISSVIMNVAGTFIALNGTVKANSEKIVNIEENIKESADHQKRFNEYVVALKVQQEFTEKKIEVNSNDIKENERRLNEFVHDYSK